ncbi:hypothetical protein AAZX31_07G204900 [Glycine max]
MLRSRRRSPYDAYLCAVISVVLLLLSVSLLHSRLSRSHHLPRPSLVSHSSVDISTAAFDDPIDEVDFIDETLCPSSPRLNPPPTYTSTPSLPPSAAPSSPLPLPPSTTTITPPTTTSPSNSPPPIMMTLPKPPSPPTTSQWTSPSVPWRRAWPQLRTPCCSKTPPSEKDGATGSTRRAFGRIKCSDPTSTCLTPSITPCFRIPMAPAPPDSPGGTESSRSGGSTSLRKFLSLVSRRFLLI